METTYGTKNPAELPEHQVAMMSGRKIARRFKLGKKEFVVFHHLSFFLYDKKHTPLFFLH